jgi:uncharacterized SAM-binding protein YcdF (DUF218 family)
MRSDLPTRFAPLHPGACVAAVMLLVAAGASVPAWHWSASILRSAADGWAVSDTLAPADAVAVLGGGSARPYAAAELYRRGVARRVLIDDDNIRALMLSLNVPSRDIEMFGSGLHNTYGEACALAEWVGRNGAQRVIIPTEFFPSRRVKWVFARKLGPLGAAVEIDILQIAGYGADDWWSNSAARNQFVSEIAKYFYYRTRYIASRC